MRFLPMSKLRILFAAIVALGISGAAHAQCTGGLIVGCPPAQSLQQNDLLLLWQGGQNPHMRSLPVGSVASVGPTSTQQVSQSVSNAAYGVGQAVGGLMTFDTSAHAPLYSGSVQAMTISLPDAQIPTLDVLLFTSQPTTSTITNGQTVVISAADQAKQIGVLHVSDCTSYAAPTLCQTQQWPIGFSLGTLTTLYAAIVARNSFTPSNLPVGEPAWVVTLVTQQQ